MKKKVIMQLIMKVVLTKKFNSNVEEKIQTKLFVAFSTKIKHFSLHQFDQKFSLCFRLIRQLFHEFE